MATKYGITGGGNWSGASWATASNQAVSDTTKPVNGDTAILDAYSGQITVDAASACTVLNCTGYTNTLTLGANLTVAGSITLVAGMTFTPSTYTVTVNAASTITSGGKAFYGLTITGGDLTLVDTLSVTNLAYGSVNLNIIGNQIINIAGNFLRNTASDHRWGFTMGNCTLNFNGTGSQTFGDANGLTISTNITFDKTAGTLTMAGTTVFCQDIEGKTFSYVNSGGTIDAGTSLFQVYGNSCTLDINGINFYDFSFFTASPTITLTSDLMVTHALTYGANVTFSGTGRIINCQGDFKRNTALGYRFGGASGTTGTTLTFNGGNNQAFGDANNNLITMPVVINKSGNTLTLANTISFAEAGSPTLTYTAGTVNAGTSTLLITGACTLNTNGMSWYNISMGANIALTSNLTLTNNWTKTAGTLSGNYAVIFDGTSTLAGATSFYNFTINAGKTVHLTSTQTFAVTGTFTAIGTSGAGVIILDATTPDSQANFNVTTVGTVSYVTATDINSSGGSEIYGVNGTLDNATNWTTSVISAIRRRIILSSF